MSVKRNVAVWSLAALAACGSHSSSNEIAKLPDGTIEGHALVVDEDTQNVYGVPAGTIAYGRMAIYGSWQPFFMWGYAGTDIPKDPKPVRTVHIGNFDNKFEGGVKEGGILPCSVTTSAPGSAHIYSEATDDPRQYAGRETTATMRTGTENIVTAVKNATIIDDVRLHQNTIIATSIVNGGNWTEYDPAMVSAMRPDYENILTAVDEFCAK